MNLVEQFEACALFLKQWKSFLDFEPIRNYPDYCPEKISDWVDELQTKDINELVELENSLEIKTAYPELENLLLKIKELTDFPTHTGNQDLSLISNKIKKKKQHEIKQISSLVEHLDEINLIDIGSGTGYLSENLVEKRNRFSYCLDINADFQAAGKKRIENNNPHNSDKIEFKNICFDEKAPTFKRVHGQSLVLGLHACGDLSSDIINYFHKEKLDHLVVVGCCYHKLTNKYNLSSFAQNNGLTFTTNAFNLAARSFTLTDQISLERKIKIRTYRYMLHCYLSSLGHKDFIPTGKTQLDDYEKTFGEYARIYAPKLITSKEDAQAFSEKETNQKQVNRIIHTDILRVLFGRVIESYIALDRAICLEEKGHQVIVMQLFDRSLSPRNLAIIVI